MHVITATPMCSLNSTTADQQAACSQQHMALVAVPLALVTRATRIWPEV